MRQAQGYGNHCFSGGRLLRYELETPHDVIAKERGVPVPKVKIIASENP
jgi:hypothetical protein